MVFKSTFLLLFVFNKPSLHLARLWDPIRVTLRNIHNTQNEVSIQIKHSLTVQPAQRLFEKHKKTGL